MYTFSVFTDLPEINTITPISPVQSDPSASTPTFAIPASYRGEALTCSAFAWPAPSVQWFKNDRPLPSGISSEQTSPGLGIVSAMLTWTRPFVSSDVGTYKCLIRWDNTTIQSTVEIVQGPTVATPPPSRSVSSTSQEFPDNQAIILIAAPVSGVVFTMILVLVIVLCCIYYNYSKKKRREGSVRRAWYVSYISVLCTLTLISVASFFRSYLVNLEMQERWYRNASLNT